MADNFYSRYPDTGSSSDGVTSLNTLAGALTLAAGSNITITPSGGNTLTIASTGGGSPTGDINTLAYFDASGDLSDNTSATFDASINALAHGIIGDTGTVTAEVEGAYGHGYVDGDGAINALGIGSTAAGSASASAIEASDDGSMAIGIATVASSIEAGGAASFSMGKAANSGNILAGGSGSHSRGSTDAGTISSNGVGATAYGKIIGSGGEIRASGDGSRANGNVSNGRKIIASNDGSIASGRTATGNITSAGIASFTHGDLLNNQADLATVFGLGNVVSSYASLTIGQYATVDNYSTDAWVDTDPLLVLGNGTGTGSEHNSLTILKDGTSLLNGNLNIGKTLTGDLLKLSNTASVGSVGFTINDGIGDSSYILPDADGDSNQVMTTDGAGQLSWSTSPPYVFNFGDGGDGAAVMDGVNTFDFASLDGSTYTLLRQVYFTDLTVNTNIILKPGPYSIFGTGTLTIQIDGLIDNSGTEGGVGNSDGSPGIPGGGGGSTPGGNITVGDLGDGGAGGSGGPGNVALAGDDGGNTNNGIGIAVIRDNAVVPSGNGGAGGNGFSGSGGAGGTITASLATSFRKLTNNLISGATDGACVRLCGNPGGAGGGGGAGDAINTGAGGGGGGGGGGLIAIFFHTLDSLGTISANGGGGGGGASASAGNAGGSGGGAGGAGGMIYMITDTVTNLGTITVDGADGGGGGLGSGTGTDGTNGDTSEEGLIMHFEVSSNSWL